MRLVACHECDLLNRVPPQPEGGAALCSRCQAILHRSIHNSIERVLALSVAALVLFVVANTFPFLDFRMQGLETRTTLMTGIMHLYEQGMWEVALMVLATTILTPLLQIIFLIYIMLPLYLDRLPWKPATVFRWMTLLRPWGMLEVFLIGILVALVKLLGMAEIIPGPSLWAFCLLIVVLAASMANLDPQEIWDRMDTDE